MEEIDYTVEISDRDSFFQDCEECRLLSPSLAGLEESGMSGMSDMDDAGSFRTIKDRKVHVPPSAGLLQEAECSVDYGPPDCEGSPVEHCLCRYGVGGMENVLSGSEEDLHLQSVNTFFEGLRFLTEAEGLTEPSQMGAGKNPEPLQGGEEEMRRDGPQASVGAVPKSNIPKLNSEAADVETTSSVNSKQCESDTHTNPSSPDIPVYGREEWIRRELRIREENSLSEPERESFNREADPFVTTANAEVRKQTPSHESEKSPDCGELLSKWVNGVRQGAVLSGETALNKNLGIESPASLEVMSKCKLEKGRDVTLSSPDADPKYLNSGVSQACCPSPSAKKKRRKKKRVSFELVETAHRYARQFIASESDSDYESCIWGRGKEPHLSGNKSVTPLNQTENNVETSITAIPAHWKAFQRATIHNLSLTPMENKVHMLSSSTPLTDCQYQNLSEMFDLSNTLTDARCKATDQPGNIISADGIGSPKGQTSDDVNLSTNVQSCSILDFKGSTELNKEDCLPVSNSMCVTSKVELDPEMAACDRECPTTCKGEATHGVSFKQSNESNSSNTAQDTSLTQIGVSQSSSNSDSTSEQSHKEPTCESDMAVADGAKSGEGEGKADPPRPLVMNCHDEAQRSFPSEKTSIPVYTVGLIGSGTQHLSAQETMHEQLTNKLHDANHSELPPEVSGAESNDMSPSEHISCYLEDNNKAQIAQYSPAVKLSTEHDHSSEIMVPSISHEMKGELNRSSTINSQRQTNSISSTSDNTTSEPVTPVTPNGLEELSLVLNKEPIMEIIDESTNSMSNNTCMSVCPNITHGHGESVPQTTVGSIERSVLQASKQNCHPERTEDALTTFETDKVIENAPDSKHSVFAMSSFWKEMEKLTIKDILGLRAASDTPSESFLPPLPENMDSDNSDGTDSGYFGSKADKTSGDMSSISNVAKSNSDHVMDSSNTAAVMWVREPETVCLGEYETTSVSDIPQPLLSTSSFVPKKMAKTISVHNLAALESEPCASAWRGQTLSPIIPEDEVEIDYFERMPPQHSSSAWRRQTLSPIIPEDGEVEIDYFDRMPPQKRSTESLPPSSFTEHVSAPTYSLANLFGYFFGQKQSKPAPSDYSRPPCYIGDSVPEAYDHFFSEFDLGRIFSPLSAVATGHSKDQCVPIFSTNRNLQFPEGYDYFFPSSSSDEDEDDSEFRQPIQVVTRLSQKAREAPIASDIYENFFADGDQHKFFWKNTFSLRNVRFTSSVSQNQKANSLALVSQNQRANSLAVVPVKQTNGSIRRPIHPIGMLGSHNVPDPLLYHQDRILKQLAEKPGFKYDDLQTAVANPRLDTPFLPLRQSDMCLVCIAFASWVLKSANPQVDDAWKAVLLANISALSAIRYIRKSVRKEAPGEKTLSHNGD